MNGTVTDDGLPFGIIKTEWSTVIAPAGGIVTFSDYKSVDTTAEFSLPGMYRLKLWASDGELDANDYTDITVNPDPNENLPPEVEAGSDYEHDLTGMVDKYVLDLHNLSPLEPNVTDDGLPPPGSVDITWSVAVGNVTAVSFSDTKTEIPTVTFTDTGTYILQLQANDGEFTVSDQVSITINLPEAIDYACCNVRRRIHHCASYRC